MPSYTYTGPIRKAVRKGACPTCGKPATRSGTFQKTVNPFNKNADGTVKTWAQVEAAVKAEAEAWNPPAEEFEHDKCKAARLAPAVAEPQPVSAERAAATAAVLDTMDQVGQFVRRHGLPLGKVELHYWRDEITVQVAFVPDGDIIAWARAFGVATLSVDDGGHGTGVRLRHQADGLHWKVDAFISKPHIGDRLGDTPIAWERNERTGRRGNYGTVTVDDLAAGLARMGIAVTTTAAGTS